MLQDAEGAHLGSVRGRPEWLLDEIAAAHEPRHEEISAMPIRLGVVGHFSLAVRNPKKSARWWTGTMGLKKEFEFPDGIVVGNDAVAIALFKGVPRANVMEHMSFHLASLAALRSALALLRRKKVDLEDPGDEIGPEAPGSKNMGIWLRDPDGYRWELAVLAKPAKKSKKRKGSRKRA